MSIFADINHNFIISTFFIFVSGFFTTLIGVPISKRLGNLFGIIDRPSIRKKKFYPKVRLGGLAIAIGFVGCFILTSIFFNEAYQSMFSDKLTQIVLISGFLIFLVGLADDIFVLQPWPRLIAQFTVCFFCWLGGLRINIIDISWIPFINGDVYELSLFLSLFITLFWIVGVINSINWLDGMDGLAASYTGLVSIGISIISLSFNHTDIFFIAILTTSCCLAFLKYNLNPSSILMGDGGSYLLGFLLAIMSLLSSFNEMNVLFLHLPAFLLSLSILDMIFVISKRLLAKRSPFYPDRQHIQHRILNLGLDEKSTLLFISILTLFTILLALIFVNKLLAINALIFLSIYSINFLWKNKNYFIKNKNIYEK